MSLRQAINAMCRACIYDDTAPGNWRQQITACTSPKCPLYQHRPVSRPKDTNSLTSLENGQFAALMDSGRAIG